LLTPPEAGPGGYWEIFFAEYALPITMPATVPEPRVRALCEALGVPYRLRPPLH
jgi:hypothetical protein